jgi:hypothetical protein
MTETVRVPDNSEFEEAAMVEAAELSRKMGREALYLLKEKTEPVPDANDDGLEIITFSVSSRQRADNQQTVRPRGLRRGL